ncbi:hypothetical protein KKF91_14720 [Myxococcota bacterium]|nr:hypothetical protein [Myxococcota bacterium]
MGAGEGGDGLLLQPILEVNDQDPRPRRRRACLGLMGPHGQALHRAVDEEQRQPRQEQRGDRQLLEHGDPRRVG